MQETRPAITHEYIAGQPSLRDDSQHGLAVCDGTLIARIVPERRTVEQAITFVERGKRCTRPGEPTEPTCSRCQAHRRCLAGEASDSDRQQLSIRREKEMDWLGPVESHACPHHQGCRVKSRRKWKHQRRPTKEDITRIERCIEQSTELAIADEEHHPDEWDNVIRVLETIRQERLAGPAILDPMLVVIEPCMICKMSGRSS